MIKILFLETSLKVGGTERMWKEIIAGLDKKRFFPVVVCLYQEGTIAQELRKAGVRVYSRIMCHKFDLWGAIRLLQIMRSEKIDIVYMVNQPLLQFWGTLISHLAGVSVRISCIHSTGKISHKRRRLLINRLTFPFVEVFTAVAHKHRDYLIEKEKIPADKIRVVPNGIRVEEFIHPIDVSAKRKEIGLEPRVPVVGIVAMLRPEKAHKIFLQAAKIVREKFSETKFLIIGDGPQRKRLESMVRDMRLDENVTFLGQRRDIAGLIHILDIGVLSSYSVVETLAVSVLEYMACAKPVVATDVGSLSELVKDNETGFLVSPGDWRNLGERIIQLISDSELASRLGRAGQELVKNNYTAVSMINALELLFIETLKTKRKNKNDND